MQAPLLHQFCGTYVGFLCYQVIRGEKMMQLINFPWNMIIWTHFFCPSINFTVSCFAIFLHCDTYAIYNTVNSQMSMTPQLRNTFDLSGI